MGKCQWEDYCQDAVHFVVWTCNVGELDWVRNERTTSTFMLGYPLCDDCAFTLEEASKEYKTTYKLERMEPLAQQDPFVVKL